jgi:hypothetical protein
MVMRGEQVETVLEDRLAEGFRLGEPGLRSAHGRMAMLVDAYQATLAGRIQMQSW